MEEFNADKEILIILKEMEKFVKKWEKFQSKLSQEWWKQSKINIANYLFEKIEKEE